jgi:hypothetical protein
MVIWLFGLLRLLWVFRLLRYFDYGYYSYQSDSHSHQCDSYSLTVTSLTVWCDSLVEAKRGKLASDLLDPAAPSLMNPHTQKFVADDATIKAEMLTLRAVLSLAGAQVSLTVSQLTRARRESCTTEPPCTGAGAWARVSLYVCVCGRAHVAGCVCVSMQAWNCVASVLLMTPLAY